MVLDFRFGHLKCPNWEWGKGHFHEWKWPFPHFLQLFFLQKPKFNFYLSQRRQSIVTRHEEVRGAGDITKQPDRGEAVLHQRDGEFKTSVELPQRLVATMLVTQTEFLRWWKMYYHPPTCCETVPCYNLFPTCCETIPFYNLFPTCFETIPFYNLFPSCCETIRWCVTWTGQYRFPIKVSFWRNRSVIAPFADQKYFGTIRDVEILICPNNLDFSSKCVFAQAKKLSLLAFVFVFVYSKKGSKYA